MREIAQKGALLDAYLTNTITSGMINTYKKISHKEILTKPPNEIIQNIKELDKQIQLEIEELEKLLK